MGRFEFLNERAPRFESPLLERWPVGLRLKTAFLFGPEAEALAFQSLQSEVGGAAAHRVDGWRGRLSYRQGQYERAAGLHLRAADAACDEVVRMSHLLNAGSACLESDDMARVEAIAARVHDFAVSRRLPYFASRAIWLQRAALYRAGRAGASRPELAVEAVELAPRAYAGLIALTEAARRFSRFSSRFSRMAPIPAGGRFVERILSAAGGLGQQGRSVFSFLQASMQAAFARSDGPSLLVATAVAT